ncbi:MAG: hypothetical protein ACI87O_001632 [Planctomycetota bacterium]|jgi:hypothetical protein
MKPLYHHSPSKAGFTLLELTIAASLMTVIMASMVVGLQSEAKNLSEMASTSHRERSAQVVMHRIEQELEFAAGTAPTAWLTSGVGGGSESLQLDSSAGFPPNGTLLLEPGSPMEERVVFSGLDSVTHTFNELNRGQRCTSPYTHAEGVRVYWAGGASALINQIGPPASQWDGQALTADGPLFFRGDGTGFSYRVPTDPAGGADYFDATGIRWGSKVAGNPSVSGWSALMYVPTRQIVESDLQTDINSDGDEIDVFSLGQIRLVRWDAFNNGVPTDDLALCPPIIAQEVCNYGGDMDGDGFADPMFLWNPSDGSLRIRLTIVSGQQKQRAVVNRIANTLYLRNGAL